MLYYSILDVCVSCLCGVIIYWNSLLLDGLFNICGICLSGRSRSGVLVGGLFGCNGLGLVGLCLEICYLLSCCFVCCYIILCRACCDDVYDVCCVYMFMFGCLFACTCACWVGTWGLCMRRYIVCRHLCDATIYLFMSCMLRWFVRYLCFCFCCGDFCSLYVILFGCLSGCCATGLHGLMLYYSVLDFVFHVCVMSLFIADSSCVFMVMFTDLWLSPLTPVCVPI